MTHIGKIVLIKYEQYKRITHIWGRKTIHNTKNDVEMVVNTPSYVEKYRVNFDGNWKEHFLTKKSYKIYTTKKEGYKLIGYVFWDFVMNRLYHNKYYTNMRCIEKSNLNRYNHLTVKEIYINPDETDEGFTIG
jgi:hypothetical protein